MWVNTFGLELWSTVKKCFDTQEAHLGEKRENHIEATSGLRLPRLDGTAELIRELVGKSLRSEILDVELVGKSLIRGDLLPFGRGQ